MKFKSIFIITIVAFLISSPFAESQEVRNFPFEPFAVLKSWNYDLLIETMGEGEEIIGTSRNQTYLAALKYPYNLIGMQGNLEFTFYKDSISRIQFRKEHKERVIGSDFADLMARDTTARKEYNSKVQMQDSLRRDSVVKTISEILGPPLSSDRTPVTEKNARHSAFWINRGYSCLYKDYLNYSEIVFSLSTVPLWIVGEFDIPGGTEILRKTSVNTKRLGWSASLLGFPSVTTRKTYSDIFLLLEFTTGQRYLASVPKTATGYLSSVLLLEFARGQRFHLNVPNHSIGYLPDLSFEDCNGDAIPEAWIQVPNETDGTRSRHFIFSLQYKEPHLIFSSDDMIPSGISFLKGSDINVAFPDGTSRIVEFSGLPALPEDKSFYRPMGFNYMHATKLNTDGSTNFIAGIRFKPAEDYPDMIALEITYTYSSGAWEADQVQLVSKGQ